MARVSRELLLCLVMLLATILLVVGTAANTWAFYDFCVGLYCHSQDYGLWRFCDEQRQPGLKTGGCSTTFPAEFDGWIQACQVLAVIACVIAIATWIYAILVALAVAIRCPAKVQDRMHIVVSLLLFVVTVCLTCSWAIFAGNGLYGTQGNAKGQWGFNCMVASMFFFAFCTIAYYIIKRAEVSASPSS